MGSTSNGLPYPDGSDGIDIPGDIQALADALDTTLTGAKIDVFTSNGTWTKASGARKVLVYVQGGGAAGGGTASTSSGQCAAASGGNSGAWGMKLFDASALGSTESVTVGGAGTAGTAGNNSGNGGGSSTFSTVSAGGGNGGGGSAANTASSAMGVVSLPNTSPATCTGGDLNVSGGLGRPGIALNSDVRTGSVGADSVWGKGGGNLSGNGSGAAGTGYGSGGSGAQSGASQSTRQGSAGVGGVVVAITFF